jgi:hypothetical protein
MGPTTNIAGWALVAAAALFIGLRIFCKYWSRRRLWWDDYLLLAAWVSIVRVNWHASSNRRRLQILLLVNQALTTVLVNHDMGKHIVYVNKANIPLISLVGNITALLVLESIAFSKTSFALTLLKLTEGWLRWYIWFGIATVNISIVFSAIMSFLHCTPGRTTNCWDNGIAVGYNVFSAGMTGMTAYCLGDDLLTLRIVYSGVVDLTLVAIAWKLLLGLQMKRNEKVAVMLAMSMGVL